VSAAALVFALAGQLTGVTTYTDSLGAFSVDIPQGWRVESVNYSVSHYRCVFLCINSSGEAVRVEDETVGNVTTNSPESMARQLKPGVVYLDFATFEGPGRSRMFGPGREDSFQPSLKAFLSNKEPAFTSREIDVFRLSFFQCGSRWDVMVACRKPYKADELRRAFEILKSLRFHDLPIVNEAQAVGAAVRCLPPAERGEVGECLSFGWLAMPGRSGEYQTEVFRAGENFVVTLVRLDGSTDDVVRTWSFLVRRNGVVEPVSGRH